MNTTYHGIAWAGFYVEDLAAATEFYKHTVGLKLLRSNPRFAHFDAGGGALLELLSGGTSSLDAKDPADQSVVVALRVDDLAATQRFLESKGVRFTDNSGQFENTAWATFIDREGNLIELKEIA